MMTLFKDHGNLSPQQQRFNFIHSFNNGYQKGFFTGMISQAEIPGHAVDPEYFISHNCGKYTAQYIPWQCLSIWGLLMWKWGGSQWFCKCLASTMCCRGWLQSAYAGLLLNTPPPQKKKLLCNILQNFSLFQISVMAGVHDLQWTAGTLLWGTILSDHLMTTSIMTSCKGSCIVPLTLTLKRIGNILLIFPLSIVLHKHD